MLVGGVVEVKNLMDGGYPRVSRFVITEAIPTPDDKLVLRFEPGSALNQDDAQHLPRWECEYSISVMDLKVVEDGNCFRAMLYLANEEVTITPPNGVDIESIMGCVQKPIAVLATA